MGSLLATQNLGSEVLKRMNLKGSRTVLVGRAR